MRGERGVERSCAHNGTGSDAALALLVREDAAREHEHDADDAHDDDDDARDRAASVGRGGSGIDESAAGIDELLGQ